MFKSRTVIAFGKAGFLPNKGKIMKNRLLALFAIGAISVLAFVSCDNNTTSQVTPDPDTVVVEGTTTVERGDIDFHIAGGLTQGQVNAITALINSLDVAGFANYVSSVRFDPEQAAGFEIKLTGEGIAAMADVTVAHLANADTVMNALNAGRTQVQTARQSVGGGDNGGGGDKVPVHFIWVDNRWDWSPYGGYRNVDFYRAENNNNITDAEIIQMMDEADVGNTRPGDLISHVRFVYYEPTGLSSSSLSAARGIRVELNAGIRDDGRYAILYVDGTSGLSFSDELRLAYFWIREQ